VNFSVIDDCSELARKNGEVRTFYVELATLMVVSVGLVAYRKRNAIRDVCENSVCG